MLSQGIRQLQQQGSARQRRHFAPLTKRLAGALYRAVRLVAIRRGDLGDRPPGGRVDHRKRRAAARLSLTGDKLPVRLA